MTPTRARRARVDASAPRRATAAAELVLDRDASLLDIVDNVLNNGVVLSGDLTIALAHVDLIYARLSLLLCAADRVLPPADIPVRDRRSRQVGRARPRSIRW